MKFGWQSNDIILNMLAKNQIKIQFLAQPPCRRFSDTPDFGQKIIKNQSLHEMPRNLGGTF
jgi:hypothetical protein